MEICRVCLSTEKPLLPLDESFVSNYNILTNLNITLLDGLPQQSCQTCLESVKCYVEFREKSIKAETILRDAYFSGIKSETEIKELDTDLFNSYENDNDEPAAIKLEVKQESDDAVSDSHDASFDDYNVLDQLNAEKDEVDIKHEYNTRKKQKKPIKENKYKLEKNSLSNGDQLLCGICPEKFEDKVSLNKHLETHTKHRQCELCREEQNSLSQLLAHRLSHVPVNQYYCHICEKRYRACLYLEFHYRLMHIEEDDKKLTCNHCKQKFKSPKRLHAHQQQVHAKKRFFCATCSKGFQNKNSLRSHVKSHSTNKDYACDVCGFSCKHRGGLRDHIVRKHTPQKVYCKQCKRPFMNQAEHDKHKCKPANKKLICSICGLMINGTNRLSKHMMVHSDVHQFECNRCPAKYKTKQALTAHLDRHDGNRTKQCEYCPAKFYTGAVLIKHRRIHTGEKPYVCKVCNKGFTGGHNLRVHMKVHGEYLVVKKNTEKEEIFNVTK